MLNFSKQDARNILINNTNIVMKTLQRDLEQLKRSNIDGCFLYGSNNLFFNFCHFIEKNQNVKKIETTLNIIKILKNNFYYDKYNFSFNVMFIIYDATINSLSKLNTYINQFEDQYSTKSKEITTNYFVYQILLDNYYCFKDSFYRYAITIKPIYDDNSDNFFKENDKILDDGHKGLKKLLHKDLIPKDVYNVLEQIITANKKWVNYAEILSSFTKKLKSQ